MKSKKKLKQLKIVAESKLKQLNTFTSPSNFNLGRQCVYEWLLEQLQDEDDDGKS